MILAAKNKIEKAAQQKMKEDLLMIDTEFYWSSNNM